MDLSFSKKNLLAALESRRAWAVAFDKKQKIEHKKAEQAALKKYRAELRKALKQTYAQAKKAWRGPGIDHLECPKSMVTVLDDSLSIINLDGRARYTITDTGHFKHVHYLLTHNENIKPSVC